MKTMVMGKKSVAIIANIFASCFLIAEFFQLCSEQVAQEVLKNTHKAFSSKQVLWLKYIMGASGEFHTYVGNIAEVEITLGTGKKVKVVPLSSLHLAHMLLLL